jgi:hypothetical protein
MCAVISKVAHSNQCWSHAVTAQDSNSSSSAKGKLPRGLFVLFCVNVWCTHDSNELQLVCCIHTRRSVEQVATSPEYKWDRSQEYLYTRKNGCSKSRAERVLGILLTADDVACMVTIERWHRFKLAYMVTKGTLLEIFACLAAHMVI